VGSDAADENQYTGVITMSSNRNYSRYVLRKGHEIVYIGITDDPARRDQEHRAQGKTFSNLSVEGPVVTEGSARKWEAKRLETYQRNHGGQNPKYNK
jgi:predicted GIY-YIG superfamily endonuclease